MPILFGFFACAAAHYLRNVDAELQRMRSERHLLLADVIPFEYTKYTASDCLGHELTDWVQMVDVAACQQECDYHNQCAGFSWRDEMDGNLCKLFEGTITAHAQEMEGSSCIVVSRSYQWVEKFCRAYAEQHGLVLARVNFRTCKKILPEPQATTPGEGAGTTSTAPAPTSIPTSAPTSIPPAPPTRVPSTSPTPSPTPTLSCAVDAGKCNVCPAAQSHCCSQWINSTATASRARATTVPAPALQCPVLKVPLPKSSSNAKCMLCRGGDTAPNPHSEHQVIKCR